MRLQVVIGVRPQFIKAAPFVSLLESENIEYELIHTGQHYDYEMSQVFFDEIGLPEPAVILDTGSGTHGEQTAQILVGVERALVSFRPDAVVTFGDTNSTLAGVLAASKLHIPTAHVEAGVRSFNRIMPEEINRVVADAVSDFKFCPSDVGVANLKEEGIRENVFNVGDVMNDAIRLFAPIARDKSEILDVLGKREGEFHLLTLHRAENVDDPIRLRVIIDGLDMIDREVIFPLHPRTAKQLRVQQITLPNHVHAIGPVGYLDFLKLQASAAAILTDSGGLQKEAYWQGVPCLTLRDETEWVETVENGWNTLVEANAAKIAETANTLMPPSERPDLYGSGRTCRVILDILRKELGKG